MMKRLLITATVAFAVSLSSSAAEASIQAGDYIKFGYGPGTRGGIHHTDILKNGIGYDFDTFCVELEEGINEQSTYAVEAIAKVTNRTGMQLTEYTAWLYTQFLDGTLSDFTPNQIGGDTLQLAIWLGMGYSEADLDARLGPDFYDDHIDALNAKTWIDDFETDKTNGEWSGTGEIYIINLREVYPFTGLYGGHAQDQIVRIPQVPEPSAIFVWSLLGLGAVLVARRKGG